MENKEYYFLCEERKEPVITPVYDGYIYIWGMPFIHVNDYNNENRFAVGPIVNYEVINQYRLEDFTLDQEARVKKK